MEQEITFDQVVLWVNKNSNNTEAMDKLNYITYPFTSKYINRGNDNRQQPGRRPVGKRHY